MKAYKNKFVANIGTRRTAFIVAIFFALAALVTAMFSSHPVSRPIADGQATVTLHVYDPVKEYNKLILWYWVAGGDSGKDAEISASPLADEQFRKPDENNTAHTFTLAFSASDTTLLRNGAKLGFLVCVKKASSGSWDDIHDKEGLPDVLTDISKLLGDDNRTDLYFVRKDKVAFTDVEGAKMALEKITSARFLSRTQVAFETSSSIKEGARAVLYSGETKLAESPVTKGKTDYDGTATFGLLATTFDFSADYKIKVGDIPAAASLTKTKLIDDVEFINTFETVATQNAEFGALYGKDKTTFRVWAPFATSVKVNIYKTGDTVGDDKASSSLAMEREAPTGGKWGGVWSYTLEGNHAGKYYTYTVNNYGVETETIDPYAKACGVAGERGMIVDLDATDPDGWENDGHLYDLFPENADTPIVWELHVKDFSASPDSGMVNKGKYLAFTEQDTTVPGNKDLKTGVNYLKDLGITYVHLNPVYDFATGDERELSIADDTKDNFNWGYDPQNYNIPEGSYSTDPSRGEVRINEFKQMVMALHQAGIGVIMDVVYNHTFATDGQALQNTVPYYYHRTNAAGDFTNGSGCGNETASERTMYRKYMTESLKYWAEEYHIDGFRFDLMGLHDLNTLATIRSTFDAMDGGKGKKILMYGEPWAGIFGHYDTPDSYNKRVAATSTGYDDAPYASNADNNVVIYEYYKGDVSKLPERVAIFNDSGREGLRGNNDPGQGMCNGNADDDHVGKVQKMLEGGAGSSGNGVSTGSGARSVAYAAAHDNYSLWDHLEGKKHAEQTPLAYDYVNEWRIKQVQMISSMYLMSSGIGFILAGDEMGRTKYGNENSYNSPVKLNQITWSRQGEFKAIFDHYKQVIAIRKAYRTEFFSYESAVAPEFCYGNFTGTDGALIVFTRGSGSNRLKCIFNASDSDKTVQTDSGMKIYVRNGAPAAGTSSSSITVKPGETVILGWKTL